LAKTHITGLLVTANDTLRAEALEEEDEGEDVPVASLGNLGQGSVGVESSVGICWDTGIGVAGKVKPGRDEISDDSELSDTAVLDLGLTVPLEAISTKECRWVVGETSGVEAHVTRESAIKVGRSSVERKGDGAVFVDHGKAGANSTASGSEGGGGTQKGSNEKSANHYNKGAR
jgi:hypothetical protein